MRSHVSLGREFFRPLDVERWATKVSMLVEIFTCEIMLVSELGQNQNCNFPILTVRIGRRIRKTQAKIGTAIPILDRFRSDSDALVLEHQIRLVSDSETMMYQSVTIPSVKHINI